jgi:hypothetical protein
VGAAGSPLSVSQSVSHSRYLLLEGSHGLLHVLDAELLGGGVQEHFFRGGGAVRVLPGADLCAGAGHYTGLFQCLGGELIGGCDGERDEAGRAVMVVMMMIMMVVLMMMTMMIVMMMVMMMIVMMVVMMMMMVVMMMVMMMIVIMMVVMMMTVIVVVMVIVAVKVMVIVIVTVKVMVMVI